MFHSSSTFLKIVPNNQLLSLYSTVHLASLSLSYSFPALPSNSLCSLPLPPTRHWFLLSLPASQPASHTPREPHTQTAGLACLIFSHPALAAGATPISSSRASQVSKTIPVTDIYHLNCIPDFTVGEIAPKFFHLHVIYQGLLRYPVPMNWLLLRPYFISYL